MQNDPEDISLDHLLQQLSEASSTGDLERVKVVFEQWKRLDHSSPNSLEPLQPALYIAASSKQASTVSYLLDQGLHIDKVAVRAAVSAKATDVLEAYLYYDWDINKSLGLGGGPALTTGFVVSSPLDSRVYYIQPR